MRGFFIFFLILFNTIAYAQAPFKFTGFDLNVGKKGSAPNQFTRYKDVFIFSASTDTTGYEPWISDGTPEGTHLIKDLNPGFKSSSPHGFIELNGKMYFSALDANRSECLWQTDGTDQGTHFMKRISPKPLTFNPFQPVQLGNNLFFEGGDEYTGVHLWISDGSPDGTHKFIDINDGQDAFPNSLTICHDKIVFNAYYGGSNSNAEPWVTDGTIMGTHLLMDIFPGRQTSSVGSYTLYNGKLYFVANDSFYGAQLWTTDGTTSGTTRVSNTDPNKTGFFGWEGTTLFNGKMYGSAYGWSNNLWGTDGTDTGTKVVTKLFTLLGGSNSTVYKDKLYMLGTPFIHTDYDVYCTDGTDTGTKVFFAPVKGRGYTSPHSFTVYKDALYFIVQYNDTASKLYRFNATELDTIASSSVTNNAFLWMSDPNFFEYKGALWFCAKFDSTDYELWKMEDTTGQAHDTTKPATIPPFDIFPNPNNGSFTINTGYRDFNGTAEFYDVAGRLVSECSIKGSAAKVNLGAAAAGAYVMRLLSNKGLHTYKIVVNK